MESEVLDPSRFMQWGAEAGFPKSQEAFPVSRSVMQA